jgi:HEPN domain-containing protein
MGVDVTEAEAKLKLAREQAESGAFTQALGSAAQAETILNTAKEARIKEIKEILTQAETTVDEAKYLNAPVEEAERLMEEARGALSNENYSLAVENANKAAEK